MPIVRASVIRICARCFRAQNARSTVRRGLRRFSNSPRQQEKGTGTARKAEKEHGALSARLEQMSEEALEQGGTSARKAVEEAGFDPDLKRRLEERIANAGFRSDNASAFAQAELGIRAGKQTRELAAAAPWTGTESVGDASLRMLNDAYKPLRVPRGSSGPRAPAQVDTGRSKSKPSSGDRLANARDRTSFYAILKDNTMTEEEREKYREEMKARFTPTGRVGPASIQGLASLANKRIEDAIARGQFKNIPRGKGKNTERDHRADSPFLDTTEYLMNKIIQRQDIVPPWIEKQQELLGNANKFRARLRNDWRRHAARMIASKGGSLESQIARAKAYAAAEAIFNPTIKKVEMPSSDGQVSQITLTGDLKPPSLDSNSRPHTEAAETAAVGASEATDSQKVSGHSTPPASSPFRDATWEANEHSYHALTISSLNSLCRSYNLMAPQMAQRPYYNLQRELKACYAEVAPQVASEILERATRPKIVQVAMGSQSSGILEKAFQAPRTRVYDENLKVKGYGLKQFWRDLWKREGDNA